MAGSSNFTRWLTGARRTAAQLDVGHAFRDEAGPSAVAPDRVALLREQLEQQLFFRKLMEMTCAEVMRAPVTSVNETQTIDNALNLLDRQRVKLLPVIDTRGRLIGVVTRADLQPLQPTIRSVPLERSATEGTERERRQSPVCNVMSTDVATVGATTRVAEVIPRFTAQEHHHIPVVLDNKRLVGVLTQSDIVAMMCLRTAV